ncbi:hypothetical protein D9M72_607670 [compost metagenome]
MVAEPEIGNALALPECPKARGLGFRRKLKFPETLIRRLNHETAQVRCNRNLVPTDPQCRDQHAGHQPVA